jgi:hypothetical protein
MSALPKALTPEIGRRVVRIQALTLLWMSVEAAFLVAAAWAARSPALLGFAGYSAVELLSAAVVLRRLSPLLVPRLCPAINVARRSHSLAIFTTV